MLAFCGRPFFQKRLAAAVRCGAEPLLGRAALLTSRLFGNSVAVGFIHDSDGGAVCGAAVFRAEQQDVPAGVRTALMAMLCFTFASL